VTFGGGAARGWFAVPGVKLAHVQCGSDGEGATLCFTAGGAASTGDGMGRAAASSAASIRGARARVMRVGAQRGGLCVSREKEEGK